MFWAVSQLLTPCKYLLIQQGEKLLQSKRVYDFVLPAIFTALSLALTIWLDQRPAIQFHLGLAKNISDLLALLIAFYMAALAAVATFDRVGIDDHLSGGDALLKVYDNSVGNYVDRKLSYRQFISYLFGYLSFSSLMLFGGLIFFTKAWPKIETKAVIFPILKLAWPYLDGLIFSFLFFGIWQITFISVLGIYFLCERIQTLNKS